jgi:hypothetical protein
MAETKGDALVAFDTFVDMAVACLIKDRDALLAFYYDPAYNSRLISAGPPSLNRSQEQNLPAQAAVTRRVRRRERW